MTTAMIAPMPCNAAWLGHSNLMKRFGRRVFSLAKHITQNDEDAEDVLIETFQEVCPESEGRQGCQKFWLRLVTVAVNAAFRRLGHPDPAAESVEDLLSREFSVWGNPHPQGYLREPPRGILEHGMRSLDPMCRAVFVLRDIEGLSVENIAPIVNRSVAAVEVCLLRARLQLREALTSHM